MLVKLNKLKNWQAAVIIAVAGFAVFFTGLKNAFMGDDIPQIVTNPVVHSLANIRLFFEGSTFYNGQGIAPLTGYYYRPLMTTVFSLIYSVFGAHPFYYHLFQLLLCIGSAIILYLFFRYSFKPALALFLALVFLIHPLNSQVAFAIPNMQDALFFFFGILGLYLLFRYKSVKSLGLVVLCLFLSLLSKETGALFVIMALLYLLWFNRKRLYYFVAMMVPLVWLYLTLKIHAIGLSPQTHNAPIDSLSLFGRLLNAPAIGLFYLVKFIFPYKLASGYYWEYSRFSFAHVLLPLLIDLLIVGLVVYLALVIKRRASKARYFTYLFFTIWTALGLVVHLQVIPLDFTVSDGWLYFSSAGLLGMLGVIIATLGPSVKLDRRWVAALTAMILLLFGVRTLVRGTDWSSPYVLAKNDIAASKEDYNAYDALTLYYYNQQDYVTAKYYGDKSVSIYSNGVNDNNLGRALLGLKDYAGAYTAFNEGLKSQPYYPIYDNLAVLTIYYGNNNANKQFLTNFADKYPSDPIPWYCLAILEYTKLNDPAAAKTAIMQAYADAPTDATTSSLYVKIMNNAPLNLTFN